MSWLLYIDDDKDDRDLFKEICEELQPGIECVLVEDGPSAFEVLKQNGPPACIYVDMNMPLMNGLEILQNLKKDPAMSPVPVIILSTSRTSSIEEKTKQAGATDYLLKPTDYKGFIDLLKVCFKHHT